MSDKLIQALQDETLYEHSVSGFEVVETHISWILLTGDYAYKIKKPVDFGFLDFSTLELRRKYCHEEVRLNARYAPDLYLDVVTVYGSASSPMFREYGEPLEYAVKMRQFPSGLLLSEISERGELEPWHVDAMAAEIAEFHGSAAASEAGIDFGSSESVQEWTEENFDEMYPLLEEGPASQMLSRLEDWTVEQSALLKDRFEERKSEGFVRECHGDLHLGNMFLEGDRIRMFDCIEFNEELRWIDVMCEAAFVFMELCDRRHESLAWRFLNHYLQHTGDYAGLYVLAYYVVYRALIRAKVTLLRLSQGDLTEQEKTKVQHQSRDYMELALNTCDRPKPVLIITHGLSGSGKSWLAEPLAGLLGAVHIRSDIERKRLHDLPVDARTNSSVQQGIYTKQSSRATYCHMALVAADCLDAGYAAVVDAAFLKQWQRDQFRTLAGDLGVTFVIIDLQAPIKVLRERVERRQQSGSDVSEAGVEVLDSQMREQEAWTETERQYVLEIDTTREPDWQSLRDVLNRRRTQDI